VSISYLWEGVSFDPGLELGRGLFTPLEVTLLETPVDADGQVVRDTFGNVDNLLNTDISESGSDNIRGETEESLGNLTGTGVLVVKSGDESKRFTPSVDLEMDRTLGEDGSLTWSQSVADESSTVLLDEPDFHLTVNEVKKLSRPGMGVGGIHSARFHLSDSHGYAIRKERREVGDVGEREVSPGAPAGTDSSIEIKEEIFVVLEDVETSDLSRCPLQISHERSGLGGIGDLSDSLESGSEDDRDSGDELHSALRLGVVRKGDENVRERCFLPLPEDAPTG